MGDIEGLISKVEELNLGKLSYGFAILKTSF
jgi:hypothetical protein